MSDLPPGGGLLVVDKPAGWTSHDAVARVRRLAGTRRVGHAGTLDPMATGVLVLGVEKATRLLGHLTLHAKSYDATVVLGVTTNTDDAEGAVVATTSAAGVTDADLAAGLAALTGEITQVPPAVSAVKVGGVRSYARARRGEEVTLAARTVTVSALDVHDVRRLGDTVELDLSVTCSSGTYVRSLARDLGARLGVGGHLSALRRTASGPFGVAGAHSLEQVEAQGVPSVLTPLAVAAAAVFPRRDASEEEAGKLAHGVRLAALGEHAGPVAVFAPDGALVALVEERDGAARPLVVFV